MTILRDRKWNKKERFILQYVLENQFISYEVLSNIFFLDTERDSIRHTMLRLNQKIHKYHIMLKGKNNKGYDLYIC